MSSQAPSALQPLADKLAHSAGVDPKFISFEDADRAAILNLPHQTKKLERLGYIVRERERTLHASLLLSGFAMRQKMVLGGARQIVAVHMKGDLVDLQNSFLGIADHSVQVLTDSEVAYIPRESIKRLAFERPNVGMAMWHDTLVDGSIFREWIANVGRRDARTRVAHLLCEISLRLKVAGIGESTEYELPMTQEELADCVGLTPVHVNRTLKGLASENLIVRKSSRGIKIGDWRKLADAGDFDSNYLHLTDRTSVLD